MRGPQQHFITGIRAEKEVQYRIDAPSGTRWDNLHLQQSRLDSSCGLLSFLQAAMVLCQFSRVQIERLTVRPKHPASLQVQTSYLLIGQAVRLSRHLLFENILRRRYLHKSEIVGTEHPAAKLLKDDVLEPFVQWVLEETGPGGRASRYLLLSAKEYKRACRKFAAGSDSFKSDQADRLREELWAERLSFRELNEELRSTRDERDELKEKAAEAERAMARAQSEFAALQEVKERLLRLLETAQTPPELRSSCQNMFNVIEAKAPKHLIPPARQTHRSNR